MDTSCNKMVPQPGRTPATKLLHNFEGFTGKVGVSVIQGEKLLVNLDLKHIKCFIFLNKG